VHPVAPVPRSILRLPPFPSPTVSVDDPAVISYVMLLVTSLANPREISVFVLFILAYVAALLRSMYCEYDIIYIQPHI
jgi:hypothetical protein